MPSTGPIGTWLCKLRYGWPENHSGDAASQLQPLSFLVNALGTVPETFEATGSDVPIDAVTWDPATEVLGFRRHGLSTAGKHVHEWYRVTLQDGILSGRFATIRDTADDRPLRQAEDENHVTGWNLEVIDAGKITPRVFDLHLGDGRGATLRIDDMFRGHLFGQFKVYKDDGPHLEYDMGLVQWDGVKISFSILGSDWEEQYVGTAAGLELKGTCTRTGRGNRKFDWTGSRSQVLTYGLRSKSVPERALWQGVTRARLKHLMMAGCPDPSAQSSLLLGTKPPLAGGGPGDRDDAMSAHPQGYSRQEFYMEYLIDSPCCTTRVIHGWLAIPNAASPAGGYRAVLAINGHQGSARQILDPNGGHDNLYWYGDAFARRGILGLALDISHRDDSPLYGGGWGHDYRQGDDPGHGNGPHPSIRPAGFRTSDWEETGERVWDAMRALDYLLTRGDVDPTQVLVTGLSMGGDTSSWIAALDPRVGMAILACGGSVDYSRILAHGSNHPCWQWINADIREYIDASDVLALIAPRPLIVETGKTDDVYSGGNPHFVSDKQVVRRGRIAYGTSPGLLVHYLHYNGHQYHVGDNFAHPGPNPPGLTVPSQEPLLAGLPLVLANTDWETDKATILGTPPGGPPPPAGYATLFDYIDAML